MSFSSSFGYLPIGYRIPEKFVLYNWDVAVCSNGWFGIYLGRAEILDYFRLRGIGVWCFFDESYQEGNGGVTAIAACLMHDKTVRGLDLVLYNARRKHFGHDHARDLMREVKGTSLLSNNSFKQMEKYNNSRNQALANQIFSKCVEFSDEHPIWVFGAVVYGEIGILKQLGSEKLSRPVADILDKVSAAVSESNSKRRVNLVFDSQICGSEPDIAAAVRRFVAGVRLKNVSTFPLAGVSHVTPGIQLADLCAYILGKRAVNDLRFDPWVEKVQSLEWCGTVDGYQRKGIQWWQERIRGELKVCHDWK